MPASGVPIWENGVALQRLKPEADSSSDVPAILGLRVAGEMHFHALGQQALTAALATARKDRPAVFSFHTCAEAKLLLARALGWLVSTFHSPVNS